jgi:type IV pilus assembly protein PilN
MIRINLLPVERDKTRKKPARTFDLGQKVTLMCSLILLATALGIGWWWWALDRESARLTSDISAAERETARLKTILTQVDQFNARKKQLEQRVALIEELRKGQSAPVHMLDELSKAMPEMLWLTSLKQDGGELTIDGRCTTLTALSDFVGNLEHSGYFKKPVEILDSQVEQAPVPTAAELIKFTLKANFAMPGTEPQLTAAASAAAARPPVVHK